MKPLPVDVLASAINASVNAALDTTGIQATGVAVDSRDIKAGNVFCALAGERVDGHDFAAAAIAAAGPPPAAAPAATRRRPCAC